MHSMLCRFTGPTLLEALEQLEAAKRPILAPLRAVIFSTHTAGKRTVCTGRIESGYMRADMVCPLHHAIAVSAVHLWTEVLRLFRT
jgi:translation elongation factor EF-1alpha